MKPAILTDPDDKRLSWLVDLESGNSLIEATTGKRLLHYETAVNLQDLRPSQYRLHINPTNLAAEAGFECQTLAPGLAEVWALGFVSPRPCVLAIKNKHIEDPFNMGCVKGIYLTAARAMLSLAEAFNQVKSDRLTKSFTFSEARKERPDTMPKGEDFTPWDEWKFHTAWSWSDWHARGLSRKRKVSVRERYEEIKAAGYPHGFKAFEAMHRALFKKPTN